MSRSAVGAELRPVGLAGLGRAAHQDATRLGHRVEDPRQGVDQDRHPLVGMHDAADVHDDLVLGADAGDRCRLAGGVVLAQVDAGVDHAHPIGGDALLLDHHVLDRLAQGDDRGGVPEHALFHRAVSPEDQAPAQAVALDLVAQERVDLVDHRPAVAPAGDQASASPRRSAGRGPGRTAARGRSDRVPTPLAQAQAGTS